MEKKYSGIEDVFKSAFEKYTIEPSSKIIKSLKYKLWISDFFSLNLRKINVLYTGALIGGLSTILLMNNNSPQYLPETIEKQTSHISEIKKTPKEPVYTSKKKQKKLVTVAKFTTSVSKGCVPLKVMFFNESINAKSYLWNFGAGENSTIKNPEHTFNKAGIYNVTLTVNKDTGQDVYSSTITVLEKPVSQPLIDVEKSDVHTKRIVFLNKSKNADSYKWVFGDDTFSEEKEPQHKYPDYGVYKVWLIAKNNQGCHDTASILNRFVEKDYKLSFPESYRPSASNIVKDGYYDNNKSFVFYPNNYGTKEYNLSVYAPNGSLVFATNDIKQGWNGTIKGRLAPSGIYSYKAKGVYPNGQTFDLTGKFRVIVDSFQDNY